MTFDEGTRLAVETVARIRPQLAELPPMVQGEVLADLLAHFLAAHPAELHLDLARLHLDTALAILAERGARATLH